jgi:hypothetical protein
VQGSHLVFLEEVRQRIGLPVGVDGNVGRQPAPLTTVGRRTRHPVGRSASMPRTAADDRNAALNDLVRHADAHSQLIDDVIKYQADPGNYAKQPAHLIRDDAPGSAEDEPTTSRRPPRKLVAPAVRRLDHGRRWSKTASRNRDGPATPGCAHALKAYGPARTPVNPRHHRVRAEAMTIARPRAPRKQARDQIPPETPPPAFSPCHDAECHRLHSMQCYS